MYDNREERKKPPRTQSSSQATTPLTKPTTVNRIPGDPASHHAERYVYTHFIPADPRFQDSYTETMVDLCVCALYCESFRLWHFWGR